MARRSIGFPLTVGIVLTLIAVSLAVGWQILVVADLAWWREGSPRFSGC